MPKSQADTFEVDVLDLWLTLTRHKLLLVASVGVGAVLGGLFGAEKPPVFSYSTTMQLAQLDGAFVEDAGNVVAKLNAVYLPAAVGNFDEDNVAGAHGVVYQVEVSNPGGSGLLVLASKGAADDGARIARLHQDIVARVAAEHARLIDEYTKRVEFDLAKGELQLKGSKDEALFIEGRIAALSKEQELLSQQVERVRALFQTTQESRKAYGSTVGGENSAMALLLVDNQAQLHQSRLQGLEERLYIGLPAQRDRLQKDRADNLRKQEALQVKVDDIRAKISGVRNTQVFGPTVKLRLAGGASIRSTILLFSALGFVAGLFLVFFVELVGKAKQRRELLSTNL